MEFTDDERRATLEFMRLAGPTPQDARLLDAVADVNRTLDRYAPRYDEQLRAWLVGVGITDAEVHVRMDQRETFYLLKRKLAAGVERLDIASQHGWARFNAVRSMGSE